MLKYQGFTNNCCIKMPYNDFVVLTDEKSTQREKKQNCKTTGIAIILTLKK